MNTKEQLNLNFSENNLEDNLTDLAKLYANVFAAPPWNEFVKCNNDGQFKGLDTTVGSICECGGTYIEAYPVLETIDYIKKESSKSDSKIIILKNNESVIGFAWSYLTTLNELVESKWKKENFQSQLINYFKSIGISPNNQIRYFSECGIDPIFRGNGFANQLTQIVSQDTVPVIYRTNCLSPMMAVAIKLGFEQIVGPEVLIDRFQKNIFETGKIINFQDTENSQRTLFIKKNT